MIRNPNQPDNPHVPDGDPDAPRLAYVLAADIGNSSIHLGAVKGDQVYVADRADPSDAAELKRMLRKMWDAMDAPRRVAACSVNPAALEVFERAVEEELDEQVVLVGRDVELPIETTLAAPGSIGADRLCTAAAAYFRLEGACVVADFGTAVTIDCVNEAGKFIGGAILPGLRTQARSLAESTAQLPEVELTDPDWVFGADTRQAIVGGIVYGMRGAMRGLVERYATELGAWPMLVLTGGDARLLGMDPGLVQAVAPELCLIGVALAFYKSLIPPERQE